MTSATSETSASGTRSSIWRTNKWWLFVAFVLLALGFFAWTERSKPPYAFMVGIEWMGDFQTSPSKMRGHVYIGKARLDSFLREARSELPLKGWVDESPSMDQGYFVRLSTPDMILIFEGKGIVDKYGGITKRTADGYVTAIIYEEDSNFRQTLHRWLPSFF